MSNSTFECVQLYVESVQRYVPYSPTSRSQNPIYVPGSLIHVPVSPFSGRQMSNVGSKTVDIPLNHVQVRTRDVQSHVGSTENHVQVCPTLHSRSPTSHS